VTETLPPLSPPLPHARLVCGVDEAGRGPLAGPVFAAAVILDPQHPIAGLKDSKKVPEPKRFLLAGEIKAHALAWHVAWATVAEIEELNILHATLLAMRRAVLGLRPLPEVALIDGNRCPDLPMASRAIIKGDALEPCISAASILAKTERDKVMRALADKYPQYGFDRHAGYPVPEHLAALAAHGPCPEHRRRFGPVKQLLQKKQIQ